MTDRYASFAGTRTGNFLVRRLGLPAPPQLRRYTPDDPVIDTPVLVAGRGRMTWPVTELVKQLGTLAAPDDREPPAALVYDATAVADSAELRGLYDFFHSALRSFRPHGRIVIFGTPPNACGSVREATAQRALEGFVRSLGKEIGHGSTAQLVTVTPGGEDATESTLRFLLSGRSAYVCGQVIRVGPASVPNLDDWRRPYRGKVAVVTGAARGVGAAVARVLARDGARVVCLDLPSAGQSLAAVANEVRGSALQLDLTASDAPARLGDWLTERHGRVDVFVHNAGIAENRAITRMRPEHWDRLVEVNLIAQERVNDALLDRRLLADGGRIVAVASISGIAGAPGQTHYAASKAGVIGLVEALAPVAGMRSITVNAVAPGFIETRASAAMSPAPGFAARRRNSVTQVGLPLDVAEAVGWLASPASGGITGEVVRVCGQSILGA